MLKFEKSHPVMLQHLKDKVGEKMDAEMDNTVEVRDAFTKFIQSRTREEIRDLAASKVKLYHKPKELEEFKAGLDTVTNFEH
mmetsp:Transcript_29375/g.44359  ORF Transcript_29375/g.44359 Transcript_29375/m.44359 type:complete len:82 (+) Transcript_29375:1185-1430(+)